MWLNLVIWCLPDTSAIDNIVINSIFAVFLTFIELLLNPGDGYTFPEHYFL